MRDIAGQKHPPEPHWLGDETMQRRDAFFDRWPGDEIVDRLLIEPPLQFVPEPLVRPLVDMVVERALQVVAAAVGRTHGAKREAARMVDIDQFIGDRRRLRQNPEPAEWIDPLKRLDRRRFYAGAADAVKAVAAGDEVACDLMADAVLVVGDARMVGVEIMRLDVGGLIDGGEAGGLARVHQVERHLGLAVDRHRLAGRRMQVDAMTRPAEGELDAVMHQPFAMGARAGANLIEQRNGAFLEQAGADAAKHILARLAFENDVVDAVTVQQLAEQQSRRPRANDCDFCPQYLLPDSPIVRASSSQTCNGNYII